MKMSFLGAALTAKVQINNLSGAYLHRWPSLIHLNALGVKVKFSSFDTTETNKYQIPARKPLRRDVLIMFVSSERQGGNKTREEREKEEGKMGETESYMQIRFKASTGCDPA